MTVSATTYSVRPDWPVDPLTIEVLGAVAVVVARSELRYVLVGATARDLMLTHIHGIPALNATDDIDLAVAVRSWDEFHRFRGALLRADHFEPDKVKPYRVRYKPRDEGFGYPVDILPFGGVETADHHVEWPLDGRARMNVIGYEEAIASSVDVRLSPTVVARTITLPIFTALKIFAWKDRGYQGSSKDATDLALVLVNYAKAGNGNRLWEDHMSTLEAVDYDLDVAGAHLLGADVRSACAEATVKALLTVLADGRAREILATEMARRRMSASVDLGGVEWRLRQFEAGLRGEPAIPAP